MQVNIRIRDDLYNRLKVSAKNNYRTITAELERILATTLDKEHNTITPLIEDNNNNYISKSIETLKKKPIKIIGGTEEEFLKAKTNPSTSTIDEFIKFLDDEDISPKDTSWELLDGIRAQVPKFKNLSIDDFDEAQTIRQNRIEGRE